MFGRWLLPPLLGPRSDVFYEINRAKTKHLNPKRKSQSAAKRARKLTTASRNRKGFT